MPERKSQREALGVVVVIEEAERREDGERAAAYRELE
jgi:hypothetical protein